MKTTIFFALCISVSLFAQSPTSKGTINLNGNLSFSSQSYEEGNDNTNVLTLNPQVGVFLIDNLSLGLSLSYDRISLGSSSNTNWGIGPNLRYYFNSENVKPFLSIGYSYTETFTSLNDDKWKGHQFILGGGLDYFIARNVALETTVSYKFNTVTIPESYNAFYRNLEQKSKTFLIGIGINFFLY